MWRPPRRHTREAPSTSRHFVAIRPSDALPLLPSPGAAATLPDRLRPGRAWRGERLSGAGRSSLGIAAQAARPPTRKPPGTDRRSNAAFRRDGRIAITVRPAVGREAGMAGDALGTPPAWRTARHRDRRPDRRAALDIARAASRTGEPDSGLDRSRAGCPRSPRRRVPTIAAALDRGHAHRSQPGRSPRGCASPDRGPGGGDRPISKVRSPRKVCPLVERRSRAGFCDRCGLATGLPRGAARDRDGRARGSTAAATSTRRTAAYNRGPGRRNACWRARRYGGRGDRHG